MTILFADTHFADLEKFLSLVEIDLQRLWLSELCFIGQGEIPLYTKNGHLCSPYEELISEIFRKHLSIRSKYQLIFEEDIGPFTPIFEGPILLIDPIDATHNLVKGYPAFASSLALIVEGEVLFGWIFDIPRATTHIAARGFGAYRKTGLSWTRSRSSTCNTIQNSWIAAMGIKEQLGKDTAILRYKKLRLQSCFALEGALIAAGQLDSFIDLSNKDRHKVCDIAAAKVVIEESGGVVFNRKTLRPLSDIELTRKLNKRFNIIAAATFKLGDCLCQII